MKNVVFLRWARMQSHTSPVSAKNEANYQHFFTLGKTAGLRMVWASIQDFDEGVFAKAMEWNGQSWHMTGPIKPDFLFDKSGFDFAHIQAKRAISKYAPYMNPVELQILASDKMLTHVAFPDATYPYRLARTHTEFIQAVKAVKTKLVVIKPQYGLGGDEILIMPKSQALRHTIKEPQLVQAFVDSSAGIPGLYKGVHDLRVLYLGNKPVQAYIRSAAPGTFLCNMALGGCQFHVPLNKIPTKVRAIGKVFQQRFDLFPNSFYTVDFIYDHTSKPKVVEINSNPGLGATPGNEPYLYSTFKALIKHIQKHCH